MHVHVDACSYNENRLRFVRSLTTLFTIKRIQQLHAKLGACNMAHTDNISWVVTAKSVACTRPRVLLGSAKCNGGGVERSSLNGVHTCVLFMH